MSNLEQSFKRNLLRIQGLTGSRVLLAVSGGADSVAMLFLIEKFRKRFNIYIEALTVNHAIRDPFVSAGDASFVQNICASFKDPVPCIRIDLPPGAVYNVSEKRGRGIEDAARHVRHRALRRYAKEGNFDYIALGHNRDDCCETVLMKLLQGSGTPSGPQLVNGHIIRPLITASRQDIRFWLKEQNLHWCEDESNSDLRFLRNRIRTKLLPVFESYFPGWSRGLVTAARRASVDDEYLHDSIKLEWSGCSLLYPRVTGCICCSVESYRMMHPALRARFLKKGLLDMQLSERISQRFLEVIDSAVMSGKKAAHKTGALVCRITADMLFFQPYIVKNDKSGYLVYASSPGTYQTPAGSVTLISRDGGVSISGECGTIPLPVVIRSRQSGDKLAVPDVQPGSLKRLLGKWNVPAELRDLIPVIEHNGRIMAVYGKLAGFPVWQSPVVQSPFASADEQ